MKNNPHLLLLNCKWTEHLFQVYVFNFFFFLPTLIVIDTDRILSLVPHGGWF